MTMTKCDMCGAELKRKTNMPPKPGITIVAPDGEIYVERLSVQETKLEVEL